MSEYPEALLEKVAVAIFEWDIEEHDEPKPTWGGLNEVQRNVWRSGAVAALDALGLREQLADAWHDGVTTTLPAENPHGETSFDRDNRERRGNRD